MQLTKRTKVVASEVALFIIIGTISVVTLPYILNPPIGPNAVRVNILQASFLTNLIV